MRTVHSLLAIGALVCSNMLGACTDPSANTGVTLSLRILADGTPIDRFVFDASIDGSSLGTVDLEVEGGVAGEHESTNLFFDRAHGGKTILLSVDAFSGEEVILTGSRDVVLERDRIVTVAITLAACSDSDPAECRGNSLVTCDVLRGRPNVTVCEYGCGFDSATQAAACNACMPNSSACDGDDFVTCGPDGQVTRTDHCADLSSGCRAGVCSADGCSAENRPDDTACDDGFFCTDETACQAGVCTGGVPLTCDDGNACTFDTCDEMADACVADIKLRNGLPCSSDQFCLVEEACSEGTCGGGRARGCDDQMSCTADSCDEANDTCINSALPEDTPCQSGNFCSVTETCSAGVCGGGSARTCDDANTCTVDNCNEDTDQCDHANAADGNACDNGLFCTTGAQCDAGACSGGAPRICDDGIACTFDSCDETQDACIVDTELRNGLPCDSGLYCLVEETCSSGACEGGRPRSCDDLATCTTDSCDEANDKCINTSLPNGTPCQSGDFCTVTETCTAGACGGGAPRDCDDGNTCTAETCNETTDQCDRTNEVDGTVCEDGQFCTDASACSAGACTGGVPHVCDDGNTCTFDICDENANQCVVDNAVNDSLPCSTGQYCLLDEACSGGTCSGGRSRDCADTESCTADSCDETNNTCIHAAIADSTPCQSGQYCVVGETCGTGVCGSGSARNCDDSNTCTADTCDEGANRCSYANETDGTVCDDGLFCTDASSCGAGVCAGGTAKSCDDGNACTLNACDESTDSCTSDATPRDGSSCSTGLFCVLNETCATGACSGGQARACDDSNTCTTDSCDEAANQCVASDLPDSTPCNNGDFCVTSESCTAGTCGSGTARSCNDANECTTDTCDESADACGHVVLADGTTCEDGLYCSTSTTCSAGACAGGSPRLCDDSNECTFDYCDEASSQCQVDNTALNATACDDSAFCTVGESCTSGVCVGGASRDCSDSNTCTDDTCNDSLNVCEHPNKALNTPCEDGLFCTLGDRCDAAGTCKQGIVKPCATSNPCVDADASCDEALDVCSPVCMPLADTCDGTSLLVACDGFCNGSTEICAFECNTDRVECNECDPTVPTSCRADAGLLCNAEVTCDTAGLTKGLISGTTCCTSNRCDCGGTQCLEDVCDTALDVSAGGSFAGDTCNGEDNIPGDCFPGGTACQPLASGAGPEEMFKLSLADGPSASAFYQVTLDSATSSIDTALRVSTICGSEVRQYPTADVCVIPTGGDADWACVEEPGADTMVLCGLPAGDYFGAVDSAAATCGPYDLNVNVTQVSLDNASEAGNVSRGGVFVGNTCGMADTFSFQKTLFTGTACLTESVDCSLAGGSTAECPTCKSSAATGCSVGESTVDSLCAHSGNASPDAVFYLSLPVRSGVDISTQGSNYDTVLFIHESGASGPSTTEGAQICNDDCFAPDGASHIQTNLAAGLYYVVVDGAAGACGDFMLDVQISPSAVCPNLTCDAPNETCETCVLDCPCANCGDGIVDIDEGEVCDDGNNEDGDGCNGACVVEADALCSGSPSVCSRIVSASSCPGAAIPDKDPIGITDTIVIPAGCTINNAMVDVDIQHDFTVDLIVDVTDPLGTTVRLHNLVNLGPNLVGQYDTSLAPFSGANAMDVFDGGDATGTWTLSVADAVKWGLGTLACWSVELHCAW